MLKLAKRKDSQPKPTDETPSRGLEEQTMFKEVSLFPRRAGLTDAEFRDHYENRHVPLALRYNRVFAKYTRNHVLGARLTELPFDSMTEIWYPTLAVAQKAWSDYADYDEILEDERRFMDRSDIISMQTTEAVVSGPDRLVDTGVVPKHLVLLRRPTDIGPLEFAERVRAFARRAANLTRATRATLDLAVASLDVPGSSAALTVRPDAILSMWPRTSQIDARLLESTSRVAVIGAVAAEQLETPTRDLHD